MKPTLEDLEIYQKYLIKNELFNKVKDYVKENLEDTIFDKIVFTGDYEYDDEGSNYFYLSKIKLIKGNEEIVDLPDDYKLLERCFIVSELLRNWEYEYTLSSDDLEEPFVLEKK